MKTAALIAAGLALTVAGPAGANDSTAELAAGGLVLTKSAAIEMRSEDLYISAKQVRVRYHFANTSAHDVTVTVAFPMPDITTEGYDDMLAIPTQNPTNFLAFTTTVDGQPVKAQLERKAIKNGVDRTALLRSLNVPLAPHLASTNRMLDALPQARKDELVKLGLAVVDDYDDTGKGMVHHLDATWTLKTTFFWSQTFPAGRDVVVEHKYKPAVGESAGTQWGSTYFAKDADYAKARAHYCVDDDFIATAARARGPQDLSPPLNEQRIEYILTTGANWKTPIGDFHMTIDKGEPANLVSFCGEGVVKTSPTTFEVHYRNYTPVREVSVVILKPLPKQ
jgi:hypothetical protein